MHGSILASTYARLWHHSRWKARKRGPKEGDDPKPKSGEFRRFSRPGDACTVILWMKSEAKEQKAA